MDNNNSRYEEFYKKYYGYESKGICNTDKRIFLADISLTLAMIYDELISKEKTDV